MAFAVGGAGGPKVRHQRHAADRCVTGAADHLHGDHAVDAARSGTLVPQPPPPNQPPPPPNQDPNVVVEIKKDASMEINGQPIKEADLQSRLEDIFKTRATKVVFVKGDPDVDYRYIAQAIDDAKGAGLDKVGIMTPKVEAGQ